MNNYVIKLLELPYGKSKLL